MLNFASPRFAPWPRWTLVCAVAMLTACASQTPEPEQAEQDLDTSGLTVGKAPANKGRGASSPAKKDLSTRYAVFKPATFDALPGWQQDNLGEAWSAFKESCKALERKPNWTNLCAQVKAVKDPQQGRQLLEREFTLLTVQNTDQTQDGDITGYYEPLLQGQASQGGSFVVPVYGVPHDLYAFDWKGVPSSQRKGAAWVKPSAPNSRVLVMAAPGEPGAVSLDWRRFTLDTLDRRLRVRIQGHEGLPYYSRSDISKQDGLNAPVLAWVDDPVALYAMQIQGAGRIRMADGTIVRLQYADQNGHPFKPMQVASQGNERVLTRGKGVDGVGGEEQAEHFDLVDQALDVGATAVPTDEEPLTRGRRKNTSSSDPTPAQDILNDLLTQGQSRKRVTTPPSGDVKALLLKQRSQALSADPSYVFFRLAPDQSAKAGPVGALGVPLSAGRSLAVDPRVLPLGYPVFLSAASDTDRQGRFQRLMFAQDTGGAIRGAVRADYFWGYGADAGRQARQTKHRGRMWLLVPNSDVAAFQSSKLVTRGGAAGADTPPVCLVADEAAYCDED